MVSLLMNIHSMWVNRVRFSDVKRVTANTSQIPGWQTFTLDVNLDGSEYKPGSLIVEADR